MEPQPFGVPHWWSRYNPQQGRGLSTMDQSTLTYLSRHFGCLPVLLVPVDYSLPPASSTLTLAVPPVPLPQARAHEAPGAAAVSLAELEGLMGEAAAEQEGELAELGQWFHGLPPAEKRAALASVAKSLSFQDAAAASTAPATLHLPAAGPSLTIYADAALSTPAAEASAPVAAAPARRPLGDRTNTQAPVNMKQLSSKLHVVASRKQVPQLPEEEAKELLAYQLSAAARSKEATRAPWFREGGAKPVASVREGTTAGTGAFLR